MVTPPALLPLAFMAPSTRKASRPYVDASRSLRLPLETLLNQKLTRQYPNLVAEISVLLTLAAAASQGQDIPHNGRFFDSAPANNLAAEIVAFSAMKGSTPLSPVIILDFLVHGKIEGDAGEKVMRLLIAATDFLSGKKIGVADMSPWLKVSLSTLQKKYQPSWLDWITKVFKLAG